MNLVRGKLFWIFSFFYLFSVHIHANISQHLMVKMQYYFPTSLASVLQMSVHSMKVNISARQKPYKKKLLMNMVTGRSYEKLALLLCSVWRSTQISTNTVSEQINGYVYRWMKMHKWDRKGAEWCKVIPESNCFQLEQPGLWPQSILDYLKTFTLDSFLLPAFSHYFLAVKK